MFHSRSGTNGVVQEDVEGVVATAFSHWDSRAGDPQLHDHVVVANRARSVSDGVWRTLDSRGLYKSVVALSEMHQGVLSDLLTERLGWGWDGRNRRHSERLRFEVTGVSEALMAEFSQRSVAIEERKTALLGEFVAACGRQPSSVEVLDLRRRATLETRPAKEHHSLAELTRGWRSGPTLHRRRPGHGSPDSPIVTTSRFCTPATWPRAPCPTQPVLPSSGWPNVGPRSVGPTFWPRCTASCTGSVSPRPTSGSSSPSTRLALLWPSRF